VICANAFPKAADTLTRIGRNNMPGIFNLKPSGEKRREIKTKTTIDFSNKQKIPQLEALRQKIKKEKETDKL